MSVLIWGRDENEGLGERHTTVWNETNSGKIVIFFSLTNIGLGLQYRQASNPDSCVNHHDPLDIWPIAHSDSRFECETHWQWFAAGLHSYRLTFDVKRDAFQRGNCIQPSQSCFESCQWLAIPFVFDAPSAKNGIEW